MGAPSVRGPAQLPQVEEFPDCWLRTSSEGWVAPPKSLQKSNADQGKQDQVSGSPSGTLPRKLRLDLRVTPPSLVPACCLMGPLQCPEPGA